MRKFTDKIVDYIVQENLDLKHLSIVTTLLFGAE